MNPLIGSAGVSAVPMAARVSQVVGQKENPGNFLLMHAMGPNVAGVIGSAIAAGVFLSPGSYTHLDVYKRQFCMRFSGDSGRGCVHALSYKDRLWY